MDSEQLHTWNEQHPVGAPVLVWPGARDEAPKHSYVQHPAAINFGQAGAAIKGYGRTALTHVARATGDAAAHARLHREETVQRLVQYGLAERDLRTFQLNAGKAVLAEMDFLLRLPEEQFEAEASTLITGAMHRHLAHYATVCASGTYTYQAKPSPDWMRPPGLDHRLRFKELMYPQGLALLQAELAEWVVNRPEKQPYRPEIVLVEKAEGEPDCLLWVTLAVNDAREAFRVARHFGALEQKGGVTNG